MFYSSFTNFITTDKIGNYKDKALKCLLYF